MVGPIRIAIYADVNLNGVDGSSIWLASLVDVLAGLGNTDVHLLLKADIVRRLLVDTIIEHSNVRLFEPHSVLSSGVLEPADAARALEGLDRQYRYDVVLVRGNAVLESMSTRGAFAGRLWPYYLPPAGGDRLCGDPLLGRIASSSRFVLCQTDAVRAYVETHAPELADRTVLLPPMVPDPVETVGFVAAPRQMLLYVGKLDPRYLVLEAINGFSELKRDLPSLEFAIAGDKIHDPQRTGFGAAVKAALTSTPGVKWHGAIGRSAVLDLMRVARLAWALRDRSLADSYEVSTKLLEYGAAGVPPLADRTDRNLEVLGKDYPLFADSVAEAYQLARSVFQDDDLYLEAQRRARDAAKPFTFSAIRRQIDPYFRRVAPPAITTRSQGRPRILVAGHDLKFIGGISKHLESSGALVTIDKWRGLNAHDEKRSRELLRTADVVVCEWCVGNAVWYSSHKESNQRLMVRLHRFELETEFPRKVEVANVNAFVVVSPHIRRLVVQDFGWPPEKVSVVGNWVDIHGLDRVKLPESRFNLGMLGYSPQLKRLDRALDLLELLRANEPRFHLYLKGVAPWDLDWVWSREHEYFLMQWQRIRNSPLLRDAVTCEPFDGRVGAWFQKIGYLVSVSDIEGNQVAVAEGSAAGAIPLVLPRPGADDLYPPSWIYVSVDEAAAHVLQVTSTPADWKRESARAVDFARDSFSYEGVGKTWSELVARILREPDRSTAGSAHTT